MPKAAPKQGAGTSPAKAKAATKAPAKAAKAPAKKAPAKAPATKAPAKKTTTAKAPAKKTTTAKAPAKKAPAKAPAKAAKATKKATTAKAPAKKAPATKAPAKRSARSSGRFGKTFLEAQRQALLRERARLLGQAEQLEDEAAALMEDLEPGDVQFDDESGEGDSIVVERERDLALSAQARETVLAIDAALERIATGTYGFSLVSGEPIPQERLEALPWATELVSEKTGGLGRR